MSAAARMATRELVVRIKTGRALLDGVTLDVAAGEVLAIVGKNGAGKSTLLGALAGDLKPSAGEVCFDGAPLGKLRVGEMARKRAVVRQRSELAAELLVHEVVALGDVEPRSLPARAAAAMAQLCAVGLDGFAERRYPTLSGGERQRVHFARALMQLAERRDTAMLLDEPTSALDPQQQHKMGKMLREVAARGVAVAVVLHDLGLAAAYADRVAVLSDGKLITCAPTSEALQPDILRRAFEVEFELVQLKNGVRCPIAQPSAA